MEWYTPIKDIVTCLWGCTTENVVYIRDLEKNLETLSQGAEDLKGIIKDVEAEIERAGGLQLKNENEVKAWRKRADDKVKALEKILVHSRGAIKKKQGCCYKNCLSSYCLGVSVTEEIPEVQKVIERRKEFELDFVLPSNPLVDKLDVKPTVGLDSEFEKVWGSITEDQSVGMIALYGMGGIGKSTFLRKINNKFLDSSHGFDVIIWVELSKDGNSEKVQQAIRSKLNIAAALWDNKNEEGQAAIVRRLLETKKFLLLLDDQRDYLDLLKAGVPCLDDAKPGSKVVFTTRSEEFFGQMRDVCGRTGILKALRMECLTSKDALQLFKLNVDKDILADEEVLKLANDVVEECKGLPLALVSIGGTMARKREPGAWQHALTQLQSYPPQFPGMRKGVFPKLRFSYDNLFDDIHRKCFLYCSLFPEKHEIHKQELINLWIGEGFLKDFGRAYQARNSGLNIIENLENACLLEGCESKDYVKMHDVIRDMAAWIICDEGKNEEKVLVQQDPDWIRAMGISKWRKAAIISLWGPRFKYLATETKFSCCQTLIVRETKLKKLPIAFFQNVLQVLDLSHNRDLTEVPMEVKNLVSLQHLDLSYTNLMELPIEIKFLKNLKILLLNGTEKLKVLPKDVISCLMSLKIFSKIKSICLNEEDLLKELKFLENLISLGISLQSKNSINYLHNSELQRSITHLTLMECTELPALNISEMPFLEALEIRACNSLGELKLTDPENSRIASSAYFLSHVVIQGCPIKNVTLVAFARTLQTLIIDDCRLVVAVVDDEFKLSESISMFSSLKHLTLRYLPKLNSICRQTQPFTNLVKIEVRDCPNLRKLPFSSNSARSCLKQICGEESWWDQLQWEEEGSKDIFKSKFVNLQWREEGLKHISSFKFAKLENLDLQNTAASRFKEHTIKGRVESVVRLKKLDIDTIQQSYTV